MAATTTTPMDIGVKPHNAKCFWKRVNSVDATVNIEREPPSFGSYGSMVPLASPTVITVDMTVPKTFFEKHNMDFNVGDLVDIDVDNMCQSFHGLMVVSTVKSSIDLSCRVVLKGDATKSDKRIKTPTPSASYEMDPKFPVESVEVTLDAPMPCRVCGLPTIVTNDDGEPEHPTCGAWGES